MQNGIPWMRSSKRTKRDGRQTRPGRRERLGTLAMLGFVFVDGARLSLDRLAVRTTTNGSIDEERSTRQAYAPCYPRNASHALISLAVRSFVESRLGTPSPNHAESLARGFERRSHVSR